MEGPRSTPDAELLLEHAGWVRRLAAELVGDPHAAEDVVQETWLAFLRLSPDTGRSLRPWLARVVRNRAALRARSRANRAAREGAVARPEAVPSADELVERAELQRRLVEAVLALEEPYRETLLLRHYEGLTPAEIAAARGVPGATVRSQLLRGHERLRARLDLAHGEDRAAWMALLAPLAGRAAGAGPRPGRAAEGAAALEAAVGPLRTSPWAPLALAVGGALLVGALAVALAGRSERPAPRPGPAGARAVAALDPADAGPAEGPGATVRRPAPPRPPQGAAPSGSRTLTLVDGRHGAPVAGYAVVVDGVTLVSDAAGRVSVPAEAAALTPHDDPRLAVEAPAAHGLRARRPLARATLEIPRGEAGEAALLAVPAGPTFPLRLAGVGRLDPAELEARLVAAGLSPYLDDGRERQVAPVRGTADAPWVRFGEVPSGAGEAGARWSLEVRDRAGLAAGSAAVADVVGGAAAPVEVLLAPRGAVAGTLDPGPDVAPALVDLLLYAAPAQAGAERAPVAWTVPDADGRFELRWLAPGPYVLEARSPRHPPWEHAFEVAAGERVALALALDPIVGAGAGAGAAGGPLAGVVRSESGAYDGQLLLFLRDREGRVLGVFPTTWRGAPGDRRAPFAFDDAPADGLRLDVVSLADAVTADVEPSPLRAPCATVDVLLRDGRRASDVRFEVSDAATGAPLPAFEVEVAVDGAPSATFLARGAPGARRWTLLAGGMRWNDFRGDAPLRRLADEAPFSWSVRAEGYRAAHGDAGAALRTAGAAGARVVTVRLARE